MPKLQELGLSRVSLKVSFIHTLTRSLRNRTGVRSREHPIARHVIARVRETHAPLSNEIVQQPVERSRDGAIPPQLEGSVLLDETNAGFADVAGDDAGERAAQIDGELVDRLVAMELERGHRFVRRFERPLEVDTDVELPVEEVRVVRLGAHLAHDLETFRDLARDALGVREDDLVTGLRLVAEGLADERVEP